MTIPVLVGFKVIELVGPNHSVALFGVKLVGINAENGSKFLLSLALIAVVLLLGWLLRSLTSLVLSGVAERYRFWTRQAIQVLTALVLIIGVASIWFDDPNRLATALGLVTAGLAFALQRVVTAVAGYVVILRGNNFTVGDRIVMGGVRGDVVALSFTQTTIMEMGEPPSVQGAPPAMWVKARQYTGRIVSVSNARIFDEPVFNYTREFPFLWEEMSLPVSYRDDRQKAEAILLEFARKYTVPIAEVGEEALNELQRRYAMEKPSVDPQVYWRITDNWLELTVRFLVREHGVRGIKDRMSRDILQELEKAHIGIGSTTLEVTGPPPLTIAAAPELNSVNH